MSLRSVLRAVSVAAFCVGGSWAFLSVSAQAKNVTDITGQVVSVPDHPQRIVLGEGRLIYALEPLEGKHLFDRVVGWQGEFREADAQNYDQMRKVFPQADRVAVIGRTTADTISPEKVLDLHPDLAIFSTTGHGPGQSGDVTERLRAAHIPVIFVDFRKDPIKTTLPSMRILGQALDREAEAQAYIEFYQKRLDQIKNVVDQIPQAKRPRVFIDMLAGARQSCCHTAGRGNMGAFIEAAGGHNVASDLLPGYLGEVSAEKVIALDPDVLLLDGTRGPGNTGPGLKMGAQVTADVAQTSLCDLLKAPELAGLRAVREGRAYGIWHTFYDSPFNILAVEVMAKWFYPDRFASLDPDADRREIQNRFTVLPVTGIYWIKANAP
ncbi:ABC transporter substrate-binding protein [Saccharibacter sp. 17.LH.SD]|uniref:ABC transporter substrate-binding protein n=1 Tax=Saccharibacter sp. 17.LH.SD TaxID=2689393 RepID=UPI0013719FEC|nr:ABC transporter substrate-binding protein [Saccharibacter sp. 17.LH.SD]MXV44155.1 ABC transporter substrate-binding protein [Saccharibacter sp. 17.LH.SD]